MPATTVPREIRQRRDLIAMHALLARGRTRSQIQEELHISRPTYYRWLAELASVRKPRASED
jgi:DNA invertase Pin-like site-specific DNA recombinase